MFGLMPFLKIMIRVNKNMTNNWKHFSKCSIISDFHGQVGGGEVENNNSVGGLYYEVTYNTKFSIF